MFFANDRNQLRQAYAQAWQKYQQQQDMQPLERQIAEVVREHPEYHDALQQEQRDYLPEMGETNPFLHMGMHLALREQLATNRPAGIQACYQSLLAHRGSPHEAEHAMMECLAEALWKAQRDGQMPDETDYLRCLQALVNQQK
ncbi:MAG: DUF1841 family protein [Chromatiales bacterium]|jgi:hypothetical protein